MLWRVFLAFSLRFTVALCQGTLELQLEHFSYPSRRDVTGSCCAAGEGKLTGPTRPCSLDCQPYFRICLKQYQTKVAVDGHCTYHSGLIRPSKTKHSTVIFGKQDRIKYPFTFVWPGSLSIIIEAYHNKSRIDPPQLLLRFAGSRDLPVGAEWASETATFQAEGGAEPTTLKFRLRVTCADSYYGPECSHHCVPKDNTFGHYTCGAQGEKLCIDGWQGKDCNEAVCRPGCHPTNGHCDAPGTCDCVMGYEGENCTECIVWPGCKHGTCDKPYTCHCDEGWGGLFCNQDLNYCTHYQPCRNGATCVNTGAGHYTCQCESGFSGTNCQTKLEDCSQSPCQNGGTCRDLGTNYTCECPLGFSGRHCQTFAQTCTEDPCENGATCVDISDGYLCICPPGWEGGNCDIESDECQPNPCLNEGQCIDDFNGFKCVCPVGFSGERCAKNDNDCSENTCLNGGTCVDKVNSFTCMCPAGYMGTLCQDNIDDCLTRPCANGGTCFDLVNDYRCMCRPGFKGKDCGIDINECESAPCRNGGSCVDTIDNYRCECPACFSGKDCRDRDEKCLAERSQHLMYYYPPALSQNDSSRLPPPSQEPAQSPPSNMTFIYLMAAVTMLSLIAVLTIICFVWRRHVRKRRARRRADASDGVVTIDSLSTPDLEALRQNAANAQKLMNNNNNSLNVHVRETVCGSACPKVDNHQVAELLHRSGKYPGTGGAVLYDKLKDPSSKSPSPCDSGFSLDSSVHVRICE